jgi:hypothetical protein
MATAPRDPRSARQEWAGYDQPAMYQASQEPSGYYGQQPPGGPHSSRPGVDAGRLWAGGVATAIVAGLIALLGVLVCRWLFNIPLLAPKSQGAYGDVHTTDLVLLSAAAALVATGLAHLLLLSTPRPMVFFAWIVGLATVLALVVTFSTSAPLNQKAASAVVYLILGIAIGSLISVVGASAVRHRRRDGYGAVPMGYDEQQRPGRYG